MALAAFPGFCGPSSQARSVNVDAEETINRYLEVLRAPTDVYRSASATPKVIGALYPTPGLRPFVMLPGSSVSALFTQDDRVFAVSGSAFSKSPRPTPRASGAWLTPIA